MPELPHQSHSHEWIHPVTGTPLACAGCGEIWPGAPLPEPYISLSPGFGALDGVMSVAAMIHELRTMG
jgi:hypothetical protein